MSGSRLIHAAPHALALGALVAAPMLVEDYYLGVVTRTLLAAALALSLHVLVNYAGLVSLAHAAFYGVGAYTVGLLAVHAELNNLWVSLAVALAVGGVVALGCGAISLRTTGVSFIMITLALGAMLWTLVDSLRSVTGGDEGILGIRSPSFAPLPIEPGRVLGSFWLALGALAITALGVRLLRRSPFGQTMIGIRDSPVRMDALGYHIRAHQLLTFVICGMAATVPGVLTAYHNRFVSPAELDIFVAVGAMVAVVIGQRSLLGPAYAAIALGIGTEFIREITPRWQSVLGCILVVAAYTTLRTHRTRPEATDEIVQPLLDHTASEDAVVGDPIPDTRGAST